MSEFKCPKCGSENIQSLPIIYQSGTSGTEAVTGADKFIAVTKGSTMTGLAKSVAPPQKESPTGSFISGLLIVLGVICLFTGAIFYGVGMLVVAAIIVNMFSSTNKQKEEEFNRAYQDWKSSYLCHRCGNVFKLLKKFSRRKSGFFYLREKFCRRFFLCYNL